MPIEFEHDRERNILVVAMRGDISDDDLVAYARLAVEDPEIDAETNDYIDLAGLTSTSTSSGGLRRMEVVLEKGGRIRNTGRMAIHAPDDLPFGMARVFQAYRDGSPIEVRVFRTEAEARRWIGLEPG